MPNSAATQAALKRHNSMGRQQLIKKTRSILTGSSEISDKGSPAIDDTFMATMPVTIRDAMHNSGHPKKCLVEVDLLCRYVAPKLMEGCIFLWQRLKSRNLLRRDLTSDISAVPL